MAHVVELYHGEKYPRWNMENNWVWKRTSLQPRKFSQTLVPLIRETCRSDESPPKITKTFCLLLGRPPFPNSAFKFAFDKFVEGLIDFGSGMVGYRVHACLSIDRRMSACDTPTCEA